MYAYKVMLEPNNKQATRLKLTMNKCIECQNIIYDILDKLVKNNKPLPSCYDLQKYFTSIKGKYDEIQINKASNLTKKEIIDNHLETLFYDVSNEALKQTVKDTYNSFERYIKHISKYPRKKLYADVKKSFYVDPYKIKITKDKVKLEKISNSEKRNKLALNWIKLSEQNRIPLNCYYYNSRVKYDGINFWLTVCVKDAFKPKSKKELLLNDDVLGIDVNIKTINFSNGMVFNTCNEKESTIKAMKRLTTLQKVCSSKYENAIKQNRKLSSCKNYQKVKLKLKKTYQRIDNLRTQHYDEIINEIINIAPKKVVVEDLDIREMQQNRIISHSIQITGFGKFIARLKSRLRFTGIEIIDAPRYYPSSKKCSRCGYIKKDLALSDRIYICPKFGLEIDRDLNAALNLKKYAQ